MDLLRGDNAGDINFQDLGAFDHLSPTSHGLCPEPNLFNLSSSSMNAPPTQFSPHLDRTDKSPGFGHDDKNATFTLRHEPLGWNDDESNPENAGNNSIHWTEGQRHQIMAANGITSNEVDSQLAKLFEPDHDPMRIDSQSDWGQIDSSTSSPGGVHSRRTTIIIDNVAPETLTTVMQILITAKARSTSRLSRVSIIGHLQTDRQNKKSVARLKSGVEYVGNKPEAHWMRLNRAGRLRKLEYLPVDSRLTKE